VGPMIRVRLKNIAKLAQLNEGFFLQATSPLKAIFPDGQLPPLSLGPCDGTVKFTAGTFQWQTGQGAAVPFMSAHRVRLVLTEPSAYFYINKDPYAGILEFVPEKNLVINELDFESYLVGVVGNEMPPRFEIEALRAQAIASRTYALYNWLFIRERRAWHLEDNTFSQMYRGHATVNARVRTVVAETCGLVMTYDDKVFQAYYQSTCGGNTRKAAATAEFAKEPDMPPLSGVTCAACTGSPAYRWQEEYHEKSVRAALKAETGGKFAPGRITALAPVAPPAGNYANYVRVTHDQDPRRPIDVLATTLKSALNSVREGSCKSTAFTACTIEGDLIHIEGRGFGHGVGMCQYGAQSQARDGRDFLQILRYYYPGTGFMRAWSREAQAAQHASASAGL
jgi:stage II sporulation protein D